MELAAVILAAGLGTRMKSTRAKVLHPVGGVPMITHPVHLARAVGATRVIAVLGHQLDEVRAVLEARFGPGAVEVAEQREQLGTGHAALMALPLLQGFQGAILILYGDVPLLTAATVGRLTAAHAAAGVLACVATRPADPAGYGRLVRDAAGALVSIVEHRDATEAQRAIGEVNAGIYCVAADFLRETLGSLDRDNAQRELYLTDLVARAARRTRVATVEAPPDEVMGINDRVELARADSRWRAVRLGELMRAGVTVRDPATCYVEFDVAVDGDADLGPGVTLAGHTRIGAGAVIEAGAMLRDATVGAGAVVEVGAVIREARIGAGARVGAHAVLTGVTLAPAERVPPLAALEAGEKQS